jgi:PAS domain S-box-containing protein
VRNARGVLLVLVTLAVALLALSAVRSWRVSETSVGFEIAERQGGVVVDGVRAGGPADLAGVQTGDRLLTIGGHPVRTTFVADDLLARAAEAERVGLVLLRSGERIATSFELASTAHWRFDRVVASIVALVFLLGAAAVLVRPREGDAVGVYAAWCLAGALLLGVTWSDAGSGIDWLLYWVDRAARLLFPALWVHLVISLSAVRSRARRWIPVLYAPAAALMLAEVHVVGLGSALRAASPVQLVNMLQDRVELAWLFGGLVLGLALLLVSARAGSDTAERAKARWLLAGSAAGFAPFLLLTAGPRVVAGAEPSWSWAALPLLVLVPLTFTNAVIEYRLMDLALFFRRATEFAAALAFSLVLFLGLLSLTTLAIAPVLHPPGLVPALVAGLITVALAPAVRVGSRVLVARLYYRRRYSFRRALKRVARDLNAERALPRVASVLEERVAEALDAGTVRLLLVGERQVLTDPDTGQPVRDVLSPYAQTRLAAGQTVSLALVPDAPRLMPSLHNARVQVLLPLRVEERLTAILAVGPRSRGRLFDSDDLDLLRSVADHAAAAVAGAQHLADLATQVELVQNLQRRTEALIASSPMGMAVVDHRGILRHWNPALERLLGVEAAAALGRSFQSVLPEPLAGEVRRALARRQEGGLARAYRLRLFEGGGAERLVDLTTSPFSGPAGPDGLLLTLDDVTDRVRLEEQLIQQDRLASVGLLAAGVAHEVNTPLTGISSYAQMLLEECGEDDPRQPLLEKIVYQASRASHIARGLLSISRPARSSSDGARASVDLEELVQETLGLLALQLRRAGASVECRFDGEAPDAWGDRARLQQVLMNLLLNAADAVERGGQIVVRAQSALEGGQRGVLLEVEDDGLGIPPHLRDRIFDPFFTTKKPGEGTGLGLSISYSIVREHGGSLTAESAEGEGTRMRIFLPAAPMAERAGSDLRAGQSAR